ncbi:MAG: hypothetical protein WCX82_04935 [archaeon]|jgi:hypothetical protein
MDIKQKNIIIFKEAREFIENYTVTVGLNKERLKDYLEDKRNFNSINDVAESLFISLQNRNMVSSVIGFNNKYKEMREILFDFDPKKIIESYSDYEQLLLEFNKKFKIKDYTSPRSLWRQFAKGIISASNFLIIFNDKDDFDKFIKTFSLNKYTKAALPMILSKEIEGLGFALACDFLKELGYREYPKPDVHLIEIFYELGLSATKNDYDVYKKIIEMCDYVTEDAYTVDKIFWLIGSRNYYKDNIQRKSINNRSEFIAIVKKKLSD